MAYYDTNYTSLEDRIESSITEYDLERELLIHNDNIINEVKEFEDSLLLEYSNDELGYEYYSGIYNGCPYGEDITFNLDNNRLKYIKNIYLEIKLDNELTHEDKWYILYQHIINLTDTIDLIMSSTILMLLTNQIFVGNNIDCSAENILRIPLFNFSDEISTYKLKITCYNNSIPGIIVKQSLYKFNQNIRVLCYGSYKQKNNVIPRSYNVLMTRTDRLYDNDLYEIQNNKYVDIYLNGSANVLFLYGIPKNTEGLSPNPNITKIKIKLDNFEPIEYSNDNIHIIEILGIHIYVISFCKEYDSIEQMKNILLNKQRVLPDSYLKLSEIKRSYIWLESYEDIKDYIMYCSYQLNISR